MLGMNISSDSRSEGISLFKRYTYRIHVWYIYLHLVDFYGFHVGKYRYHTWILWDRKYAKFRFCSFGGVAQSNMRVMKYYLPAFHDHHYVAYNLYWAA